MYDQPDPSWDTDEEEEQQRRRLGIEVEREATRRAAKRAVDEAEQGVRRHVTRTLSSYRLINQRWLWDQRIPIGEITLLAGRAGVGKSTVLATWAAWLTQGKMRGAYYGAPQNILYVANEDSVEKSLAPRLVAAGADLDLIHHLGMTYTTDEDECPIVLPEDCDRMAEAVRAHDAVAVFLDPISSNMSDRDRNSPEVRRSYERLRRCAEAINVAVIGNAHLRKKVAGDVLEAILGSSEIGNVVRSAMGVLIDPETEDRQMILSQCKNNYGPMPMRSYVYKIQPRELWSDDAGKIETTTIEWQESTERQVNDLMAEGMMDGIGSRTDISECCEWLKDHLSMNLSTPRADVIRSGIKAGYKQHTIQRAARRLHVMSTSSGFPRVASWNMPNMQVNADGTD